jgi:thiamine pyrophosphokinase
MREASHSWRQWSILAYVRATVITGGAAPAPEVAAEWIREGSLVIAADSGAQTARAYGIDPDLIVGDFDSLPEAVVAEYASSRIRRYPRAKDHTDTEIALQIAREEGCDEVVLIGGGGGRLDHLLAIVALFERPGPPVAWISANAAVFPVDHEAVQYGRPGELISFLPVGCVPCRMASSGLRWPLDDLEWGRGDLGISNEFVDREVRVSMRSGRLLVIRGIGVG